MNDEVDLTMVMMRFMTDDPEALLPVLAKYVVMARGENGCRNMDLSASVTAPGRFVIAQKWTTSADQQAHFDSPVMIEMAEACRGLLRQPPDIDLLAPISAHDLA
jgi:quinol monooxygenase YgiN